MSAPGPDMAAQETWLCFHCGFSTSDEAEAAAHFGDRDDAEEFTPICRWWRSMSREERGEVLQETLRELNAERDENSLLRTRIEGLEFQVEGQRSEIHSFAPFRKCDTVHEVFHVYDSMEGRALVAEEQLAAARAENARLAEQLTEANRQRFCAETREILIREERDRVAEHAEGLRAALEQIRKVVPDLPPDEDWTCLHCDSSTLEGCEDDCPRTIAREALASPASEAVARRAAERELAEAARELADLAATWFPTANECVAYRSLRAKLAAKEVA